MCTYINPKTIKYLYELKIAQAKFLYNKIPRYTHKNLLL